MTSLGQLESSLKERNLFHRRENDAMRVENARLKIMRESGDQAHRLTKDNTMLREQLMKLAGLDASRGPKHVGASGPRAF